MSRLDALLPELRDYRAADALEESHRRSIVELLSGAGDAFSRNHFGPGHITASLFIVDSATGHLLLHHHRRLNRWLQMGGHVEAGEWPHETALREGAEESGLADLRLVHKEIFDLDVHAIPAAKGEPDHRHFDIRYLAETSMPQQIAIDAAESNELGWFPLDRAEELMNEEASARVIRKIRNRLTRNRMGA